MANPVIKSTKTGTAVAAGTGLTSDAWTPAVGSLVEVWVTTAAVSAVTHSTPTDTFGDTGGTAWRADTKAATWSASVFGRGTWFTRVIGTGAGSGAVTCKASALAGRMTAQFAEQAGPYTADPVGATVASGSDNENSAITSKTVSLASIGASHMLLGAIGLSNASTSATNVSPGASETELSELEVDAGGNGLHAQIEYVNPAGATLGCSWTFSTLNATNRGDVAVVLDVMIPQSLGSLEMHATAADTVGALTQTVHAGSLEAHATASDTVGPLTQTVHTGALEAHATDALSVGALKQTSTFGALESHAQGVIDAGPVVQSVGFGGLDLSSTGVLDIGELVQSVGLGDLDLTAFGDIEVAIGVTVLGMLSLSATASVDVGELVQSIDAGAFALEATADIEWVLAQLVGLGDLDLEALAEWIVGDIASGHLGPPYIPGPRLSLAGSNSAGLAGGNRAALGGSNTAGI